MSDLEVRQLRYFVAVAEELHFGRAAERLGMAQPPLSRAIRDIERRLGVLLLERTTRQVTLTPAGLTLLRDARTALDAVAAATHRAREAGRRDPVLRVALKADFDAGLLPRILAGYQHDPAALPVELVLGGRAEQARTLRTGRADVALMTYLSDTRELDVEPLVTEPRLVAVAATDPLAARTELCLADLAGRRLPDGLPAERGAEQPVPARPHPSAPADLAQIFSLVELGAIVWFVPLSVARRHPRPDLAYRPVRDVEPVTVAVAWPAAAHAPAVAAFVRAAQTAAAERSRPESTPAAVHAE